MARWIDLRRGVRAAWPPVMLAATGGLVVGCGLVAGARLAERARPPVGLFAIHAPQPVEEAFNVVFAANGDDYGDMTDEAERTALAQQLEKEIVERNLFGAEALGRHRDRVNFWMVDRPATIISGGACPPAELPDLSDLPFIPAATVVLHSAPMDDYRCGDVAIADGGRAAVILHELSHAMLHMPDEYCCAGGYWDAVPFMAQVPASDLSRSAAIPHPTCTVYGCAHVDARSGCPTPDPTVQGKPGQYYHGNACTHDTVMVGSLKDKPAYGVAGSEYVAAYFRRAFGKP